MIPIPAPPGFAVDWDALDARFDFVRALKGTAQDPIHHAEGDVWIHTRMVCEAMAELAAFRARDEDERRIAFSGALLHDVGKPDTTRAEEDGRIHSHGHSTWGAIRARQILWRLDVPRAEREAIVALVRHHQSPFWLLEREDPRALAIRISQTARCDLLALVAEADARGRVCADQRRILDNVALFRDYCAEEGCLDRAFAFPTDHARFLWFLGKGRDPTFAPHEAFRCEAILMSGLPGAGKDRWVAEHVPDRPVVSLDRIRRERGVHPDDDQGPIVAAAREEARTHLRAGRSFVWNATNLSKRIRAQCIRLFADYDARVRIVHVEAPEPTLRAQNRARTHVVPDRIIDMLLDKWELPDVTEAHEVTYVTS